MGGVCCAQYHWLHNVANHRKCHEIIRLTVSGINTNLMEVMRLLMESETVLEWPASMDQVGGSLGLRTRDLAVSKR